MNLLICMTRALLSAFKSSPQPFTTIVYPVRGQAVVIRDDLNFRFERPWYQVAEPSLKTFNETAKDVWYSESSQAWEVADSPSAMDSFDSTTLATADMTVCDHIQTNPANGLPMMDDCIDVMGNPLGMDMLSDSWSDSFSGFSDFDFG